MYIPSLRTHKSWASLSHHTHLSKEAGFYQEAILKTNPTDSLANNRPLHDGKKVMSAIHPYHFPGMGSGKW